MLAELAGETSTTIGSEMMIEWHPTLTWLAFTVGSLLVRLVPDTDSFIEAFVIRTDRFRYDLVLRLVMLEDLVLVNVSAGHGRLQQ